MRIPIEQEGGLWIAHLLTPYGHAELLCGQDSEPDERVLRLVERFLGDSTDHLGAVRGSVFRLPKLWRPIRLAVNDEGRLGIQFRHRLTGRQEGVFFADEHSTFQTRPGEATVQEEGEGSRLRQVNA